MAAASPVLGFRSIDRFGRNPKKRLKPSNLLQKTRLAAKLEVFFTQTFFETGDNFHACNG
ncbi:hypothetical protein AB2B41_11480 [Marimonas sp. MJW-29]|uniref:Transposase n=1 Tax=Sulfitobacter sediminis TaxID=3234186 RepID=A0ABV3RMX2_9RHOB